METSWVEGIWGLYQILTKKKLRYNGFRRSDLAKEESMRKKGENPPTTSTCATIEMKAVLKTGYHQAEDWLTSATTFLKIVLITLQNDDAWRPRPLRICVISKGLGPLSKSKFIGLIVRRVQ